MCRLVRDGALSYTPLDYVREHGQAEPETVQVVEGWAAVVEAATQQAWGALRAQQLTKPAKWVLQLAEECGASPPVQQGLVEIGKLSRALSRQVR